MFGKDDLVIANIKALALDMINEAKSGHPGIALGAAPILYALYANHLKVSVVDDKWVNRDRFIMSAGHGSALLYATLYMAGYDLKIDDLKHFRAIGSKTPGHPEINVTPGVDMSTGPLGQGFATAVGIALGERYLTNLCKKTFNDNKLINYYTYVLCGDGDLMEGVSYEAASLAGTQKLGKLIVLYDSNNITLDGDAKLTFNEKVLERFAAMGWHTELVKNGNDIGSINRAIEKAKSVYDMPSIIEVKTIIGEGSINAGTNIVHGKPLDKGDISAIKEKLRLKNIPFEVDPAAIKYMKEKINNRMNMPYMDWVNYFNKIQNLDTNSDFGIKFLNLLLKSQIDVNMNELGITFAPDHREELRNTNMRILNAIGKRNSFLIGGSADVASSTRTYITDEREEMITCSYENPLGKNIAFGVREHAMGAILNGIALTNLRCFGSTFLAFADYMKPAIRMSAMMDLPVTYIFTHDSIAVGEDGPTHEPVEELAMLRGIPNFKVYRPADAVELLGCWDTILKEKKPCALIVNKGEMDIIPGTNKDYVKYGAYLVRKETTRLNGVIIATGSEVKTACLIANDLFKIGIDIRVVSMVSMENFLKVDANYQKALIPENFKTIVLELGSSMSWYRYVKDDKYLLTVNSFGFSGRKDDVLRKFGLDYETLKEKIERLLK